MGETMAMRWAPSVRDIVSAVLSRETTLVTEETAEVDDLQSRFHAISDQDCTVFGDPRRQLIVWSEQRGQVDPPQAAEQKWAPKEDSG